MPVSLGNLVGVISGKDKLITHLMEGVDYRISDDGSKIIKLTEGYWNESNEPNALFVFELFKSVTSQYITLTGRVDFGDITIQSKNEIDITDCTKIEIYASDSGYGGFEFSIAGGTWNLDSGVNVYDISGIHGSYKFTITKGSNYQNQSGTIYYIKLIKEMV